MGEIQGLLHVQQNLPPAKNEDDRLPNRHDPLRMFRISRNSGIIRYVIFGDTC